MKPPESGVPAPEILHWLDLWGVPALAEAIRVEYSTRMTRCAGKSYPARALVRIAAWVTELPEPLQQEILCHEVAHVAAYARYGPGIRPHGREWRHLMALAGHRAAVRLDDPAVLAVAERHRPRRKQYLHQCPRCRRTRTAARRMPRWRCGPCYEIGFPGMLDIIELPPR